MPKQKKTDAPTDLPSDAAPLPCVCDGSDRAPEGLKRFKLRLDGHPAGARSQRYVLAADRATAEACFFESEKIDPKELDNNVARLVVTELPD